MCLTHPAGRPRSLVPGRRDKLSTPRAVRRAGYASMLLLLRNLQGFHAPQWAIRVPQSGGAGQAPGCNCGPGGGPRLPGTRGPHRQTCASRRAPMATPSHADGGGGGGGRDQDDMSVDDDGVESSGAQEPPRFYRDEYLANVYHTIADELAALELPDVHSLGHCTPPSWVDGVRRAGFEMEARVVDFLGDAGHRKSEMFAQYMRQLGYVTSYDTSARQIGASCAIVAARIVSLVMLARVTGVDWRTVALADAVDGRHVLEANQMIETDVRRHTPQFTRFLRNEHLHRL